MDENAVYLGLSETMKIGTELCARDEPSECDSLYSAFYSSRQRPPPAGFPPRAAKLDPVEWRSARRRTGAEGKRL